MNSKAYLFECNIYKLNMSRVAFISLELYPINFDRLVVNIILLRLIGARMKIVICNLQNRKIEMEPRNRMRVNLLFHPCLLQLIEINSFDRTLKQRRKNKEELVLQKILI